MLWGQRMTSLIVFKSSSAVAGLTTDPDAPAAFASIFFVETAAIQSSGTGSA